MLSFGRSSSINRRDLGCTLSRLPSQNNAEIDEKTSAVDSSPPWLDICFPSETNEEYASCTVDTAVYNHVAPWHSQWLVETEGWTVYVLSLDNNNRVGLGSYMTLAGLANLVVRLILFVVSMID